MGSVDGILIFLVFFEFIPYLREFKFVMLRFPNFDLVNCLFNQKLYLNFYYLNPHYFEVYGMIDFNSFIITIFWINLKIYHASLTITILNPIKLFMALHFLYKFNFTAFVDLYYIDFKSATGLQASFWQNFIWKPSVDPSLIRFIFPFLLCSKYFYPA